MKKNSFKNLLFFLTVFLLCHCSTKHQPKVFTPYFPESPDGLDSKSRILELETLKKRPELSLYEKKRLYDLYQWEEKNGKGDGGRVENIRVEKEKLKAEVAGLEEENSQLFLDYLKSKEIPQKDNPFITDQNKKRFSEILKIWSREENEEALKRVGDWLIEDKATQLTNLEKIKLYSLQFRIAYDLNEKKIFNEAYLKLVETDKCHLDSSQAGFLISLNYFSEKDLPKAREIFQSLCDLDISLSNRIKKAYWWFRFQEPGSSEEEKAYINLSQLPFPGYYQYLANKIKQKKLIFHLPLKNSPIFEGKTLSVSKQVSEAWTQAENKIEAQLRKEAQLSLYQATKILKGDIEENVIPLIYTAHLFKATGNHLEAMKIFTDLNNVAEKNRDVQIEFMREFPKPFESKVEWVAKKWEMDPDFVYSIMRQESAFNPGAVSATDARGLMQMMPFLAKQISKQWGGVGVANENYLFKAGESIKYSVFHLYQLKNLVFHPALIAGAYNAGINRTFNWIKKIGHKPLDVFIEEIPVTETRNYIKLVLRNYIYYKAIRNSGEVPMDLFSSDLPASMNSESLQPG